MSQQLSDFLLGVHDASMRLSPSVFQRWTLTEIRRYIDFDFAIWGAGDGTSRELHTATVLDQVSSLFNTWEPVKEEDRFANLVIGNTGRTWALSQVPDVYQSRAYNEHWRLYQARQMISTMQIDPNTGLHIFVTLARDREERRFSDKEMRFKNLITQHLFLAACHNDQHYLDNVQAPAALLDRRGLLHAALPDFTALLASEWGPQARKQLPDKVCVALWRHGTHQGRTLRLDAEHLGGRMLVRAQPSISVPLSDREKQVAWAYASGQSNKQVARELMISPETVRNHLTRIYRKLGVKDKGQLAMWLRDHG